MAIFVYGCVFRFSLTASIGVFCLWPAGVVSCVKEALAEIEELMATDWTARRKMRSIFLTATEFVIDNIWEVEPETDTRCD
jgi:hypothetical protein